VNDLLQAELIKLRTTRTFAAVTGFAVGTSLLLTVLVAVLTEPSEESVLVDVFASDTSSLFILVLAVVGISGEWRHRTIAGALLAAPSRARFIAAKMLAFAAAGMLLSLLISLAVAVAGAVILSLRDLPLPELGELAGLIARNAAVSALLGALGVGVGALARNQVVAVGVLLIVTFVAEPALISLAPEVGRFGPLVALPTALQGLPAEDVGFAGVDFVAPGLALLGMLAWIAAAYALAVALLRHRDVE
jgi:ABC-type transport system involved in multi-copper enzyme maturation permease subunit